MIRNFKNKGLKELFETNKTSKIRQDLVKRTVIRLDRLEQASEINQLNLPGFNLHPLGGFTPTRYSIHINGPWCLTFSFESGDAFDVDIEQYH